MVRYVCVIIVTALIIIGFGCDENEYTVEMRPQGPAIKRTIAFSDNLSQERTQIIKNNYQEQVEPNLFTGTFKVELPNDVGGAGFYTYFVTPMGSTATYEERFRGDDDLNQHFEDFQKFVDRYVDFAINWLQFELGKEPNFGSVQTFLDRKLRTDAKNFGLYLGLGGMVGKYDSNAADEFHQRIVLYLEERGYINPGQADILMLSSNRNDNDEFRKLFRDIIARELGCGSEEEKLAFLDSYDSIEKSVNRYIRSTERYKQMWEEEKISQDDPNFGPPEVDIHKFIAGDAQLPFEFNFFSDSDKMTVFLKCPQKPFKTNGQWQQTDNKVHWSAAINGKYDLPTFFYAKWSEPNNDFQSSHFGRVILEGENLAQYCYWEKSIEAGQARKWNEFLSGIDPNMEIGEMVKTFRFSGESAEPNTPGFAELPRTMILEALIKK